MKKIFVTLALGLATITFAQQTPQKQNWEQRKAEMQQKQQENLDKMQKDLNLSADQVKKVKALQDKHFAEMESQRAAKVEQKKQKMMIIIQKQYLIFQWLGIEKGDSTPPKNQSNYTNGY